MNPTILDVVKKEVMKLLAAGIIYPISHIVPKKSGMIVVKNQNDDELVPTRIQNGWWMCIDYRKLNQATRKDHFPLPFIDQVLERLVTCRFILHWQINTRPPSPARSAHLLTLGCLWLVQCPKHLPKVYESCMKVFMDNFSVYGHSFDACLESFTRVLDRCIEINLVLNFEKCHFMVTEAIVLGHLVDKAKIDIIASLSLPASMREVHSFLGHVALPLSKLLQQDVEFVFDQPCIEAFQELKKRLTTTPIL
ncbi:Retrovirus-related Pol polyprotein from transposon 17.6, partial [Mucuna pruriens]